MKCPFCSHIDDKVIDSRASSDGRAVRRRRECLKCSRRFTTYEVVEEALLLVVKKDGRRQAFDRSKMLGGIQTACEKRPIAVERIDDVVSDIERELSRRFDREVPSKVIGELVMDRLAKIDEVAYVRFASVYRQFKDVNQFMEELKELLKKADKGAKVALKKVAALKKGRR